MATFTPLFTKSQSDLHSFYNRKIAALLRSKNILESSDRTEAQEVRLLQVKKDLMVYRGKRTKLENMCVLF